MLLLQSQYLLVLCTFKEQLQQHVRVHAVEAVMACREIEQTLQALTGTFPLSLSHIYDCQISRYFHINLAGSFALDGNVFGFLPLFFEV